MCVCVCVRACVCVRVYRLEGFIEFLSDMRDRSS